MIFVAARVFDIGATSVIVVSSETDREGPRRDLLQAHSGRPVGTVMSRHCAPGTYRAINSADSTVWASDPGRDAIGRQLAFPVIFLLFGLGLTVGGIRNLRAG